MTCGCATEINALRAEILTALREATSKTPDDVFERSRIITQDDAGHELAYVGGADRAVLWFPKLETRSWLAVTNESENRDAIVIIKDFEPGVLTWEPCEGPPVIVHGDTLLFRWVAKDKVRVG